MVQSKKFFSILSLALISLTCFSMEKPLEITNPAQAATTRFILSNQENIFKEVQQDIGQANFIFFDTLVFSNKSTANALKQAKDNGARIEGTIGTHYSNARMKQFFNENNIPINENSEAHVKRVLLCEKDPNLGSPGKSIVYEGSANQSNYAYRNSEVYARTENDKHFFKKHFNNYLHGKTHSSDNEIKKEIVTLTPQKERFVFESHDTLLTESKAMRIKKLIKSKNAERILYITSMNWNSPSMTQALIEAQQNNITIRVIINHSALEGKGKEQLTQMHNAQVPIYVYYPDNQSRTIQHSKIMLRIDGSEYLIINSTANMTPEGDKENNTDSGYRYNNDQEAQEIQTALDKLIMSKDCKPYDQALTSLENKKTKAKDTEKNQSQAKKRLFDDADIKNTNDTKRQTKKNKK